MFVEPSFDRSSMNEEIFSRKLRFVMKGPYQYVVIGCSVSILAHQANPSLFPKFLINLIGFWASNSCQILYNFEVKIQLIFYEIYIYIETPTF